MGYLDRAGKASTSTTGGGGFMARRGKQTSKSEPSEQKDPLQRVKTEIENKKTALRTFNIPVPGEKRDDRNFVERTLNTPKDTGFLGDLFDVLSRGQYASANAAKALVKHESTGDVLKEAWHGLKGEDRTSYSDVLGEVGMKPGWKRSALGFVGNVALDPTTYVGGFIAKGAGKAVKAIPGVTKAATVLRDTKPAQILGKAFVPNFREAGTDPKVWESFVNLKDNYKNALSYAQNKAVEDAISLGKGLTKAEREFITHARQNPEVAKFWPKKNGALRKEVLDALNKVDEIFEKSAKEEMDLGLLNKTRDNYLPGIYPEKGKSLLEGIRYTPSIRATIGKHNKQKTFDTLHDAINVGLKPETDIAKLVGVRQVASKRATTTQRFIDDVVEQFGQKIKHDELDKLGENMGVYLPKGSLKFFPQDTMDLLKATNKGALIEIPADMVKKGIGVSKNVPMVALPKQVAEELNHFKKSAWDEGTKGAVKYLYDKPLNLWKAYATATNPGFHIRNALSNMFQIYLNNGKTLANPKNYVRSSMVALAKDSKWAAGKKMKIGGKTMTAGEARDLMEKLGVLDKGWFDKEIGERIGQELEQGIKTKVKKYADPNLLNPLSTNNALIKAGRKTGGIIENQSRAMSFIGDVNKGLNPEQAAKNANKFLFDYGDSTDFEKNVMRRAIPFYTWLRKNLPLQVEQLAKQPGKYAAIPKAINAVEDNSKEVDEKYLPEYMENWVRTPFEQGGNPLYLNPNLPYGDLDKLNPTELERSVLGSVTPFIKAPAELTANRNFFFESPIERYKGQLVKAPAYVPDLPESLQKAIGARMIKNKDTGEMELMIPAKARYLTKQVPFAENISRAMEYKDDKLLNHLLSFFAGAKVAPYDVEKGKVNALYDERQDLRDLVDKLEAEGELPENWSEQSKSKSSKKKKNIFD